MSFNRHRHSFIYTYTDYNVHGAFPLLYCLPLPIPLAPLSNPLSLTWNPPSCDRIRPPRSQVACKLTSPFSTLSPTFPPPNSQNPGYQRLTKTTLRIRHLLSGTFMSCSIFFSKVKYQPHSTRTRLYIFFYSTTGLSPYTTGGHY
jgi:hypothetical protein